MEQHNAWHPCPPAGLLEIANECLKTWKSMHGLDLQLVWLEILSSLLSLTMLLSNFKSM